MDEFKYPMWFKSTKSDLVVKFDGINSGEVIVGNDYNEVGKYRGIEDMEVWIEHTDPFWINVTDQHKETEKCIHDVPLDSECGECVEDKELVKAGKNRSLRPKVAHYQNGGIEPIDYINSHNFNFNRGCVIKYISRAGFKDKSKEIEDLSKARDYIDFEIERLLNVEA